MNISKEDLIKKFDGTSLEPKSVILVVHFKEVLNLMQAEPLPLSHYCYVILDVASSCDDSNLKYVIYQNLETGRIWAREIDDFFEDHDVLFPSGRSEVLPRFAEVSEKHLDILRQNIETVYPTLRFLLDGEENECKFDVDKI